MQVAAAPQICVRPQLMGVYDVLLSSDNMTRWALLFACSVKANFNCLPQQNVLAGLKLGSLEKSNHKQKGIFCQQAS